MILSRLVTGDRRMVVLILNAVFALVLGFFSLSPEQSLAAVTYGGYWAMLIITSVFVWSLVKVARQSPPDWNAIRTAPRWPAALILTCAVVLLAQESYAFKILMDEVMLLGTSMSMHFDKVALVPMRGNDLHGAFQILNGQLDKRPLFQPFLTSIFHDLLGYRPENVFILNTILTVVLLVLAYRAGTKLAGRPAGALAVLMLTSLPLLAQNATGGGFEILNLVMILATLLLAMRYAQRRDADTQEAMALAAILLAQTRYESVLYIVPVAALILWVWWQERRPILSLGFCFAPLFLLPYALHNKVFSVRSSSWELASQPGYETPFSFRYIGDNIGHALNFFFNANGEQSNSLVIAILGFLAAPFFLLWSLQTLRAAPKREPARVAMAVFALTFAAHTALLLCYFWGRFDDVVIRRLSLPLNLALVLGVIVVASEFRHARVFRALLLLTLVGFFAHSLPAMARHSYSADYYIGREAEWRREFIVAHPERDYLVIDNSSIVWVTHLVSATPVLQATTRKENVLFHFKNHSFSAVYAFQRFDVDPNTGKLTVEADDDLGPDYKLEPVWERRFTLLHVTRISRVVDIREGPSTPPARPAPSIDKLSTAEREKIRQEYFERFVQKLP